MQDLIMDESRPLDPSTLPIFRRKVVGISAVLLPFEEGGKVNWPEFRRLLSWTMAAGLVPAVNMDTGYVNLLDEETRTRVLRETRAVVGGGEYVAGGYVADRPGAGWNRDETLRAMGMVRRECGTPVLFPSFGLNGQEEGAIVAAHEDVGRDCGRFIAFELGPMFAQSGRIHSAEAFEAIAGIPGCIGTKHSSLSRSLEWERLAIRDRVRPEFKVFTGNDLAIDMVMYGSDYLLGLSACAPDVFAKRDAFWAKGDSAFYELNDILHYLGQFAFRAPVPAYKHSVAMFLKLRGWISSDEPHPSCPRRPESDREVLREVARRLGVLAGE